MTTFDYYDDSTSAIMRQIIQEVGATNVPDYVKSADLIPSEEFRGESGMMAWPARRKFQCATPADTWISAAYFAKTAAFIPETEVAGVMETLKMASTIHDITADVNVLLEGLLTKQAAVEDRPLTQTDVAHIAAHSFDPAQLPTKDVHKTASAIQALCDEVNMPVPDLVKECASAVKRSHVINAVRQRLGLVMQVNDEAAHLVNMRQKAAARGVELPSYYREAPSFEDTYVRAYNELSKLAHDQDLDVEFWDAFVALDKLAGFDEMPGLMKLAHLAYRPIEEDLYASSIKMAGVHMALADIVRNVPDAMLADVAPTAFAVRGNMRKFAAALADLDHAAQRMLLVKARG